MKVVASGTVPVEYDDTVPTTPDKECCYILLSLIESSRNTITQYPSQFPEGHSQEIALKQLDDCEAWVKGKLNEP